MRCTGFFRLMLVGVIIFLAWYTVHLYAQLYSRLSTDVISQDKDEAKKEKSDGASAVKDPDKLMNPKIIADAEKEWDKGQALLNPKIKEVNKNTCVSTLNCKATEVSFKILTGAANVIGPSICLNESILMKNSLNNVDRGMNIAVVDAKTGKSTRQLVFDLYGKDSTELKSFLKEMNPDHCILVTTYDDAAFKLDDEAREMLAKLGSSHSKKLAFRDGWVFVGGEKLKKPSEFEQIVKNEKDKNKFGDWPEAITLEGCLPLLS